METRIEKFDKSILKSFSAEVIEVLNEHFGERGVEFIKGNGKYSEMRFEFTVKANIVGGDGKVKVDDSVHSACDYKAKSLGHTWVGEHVIGTVWQDGANVYEVIGYESRKKRYPLTLRCKDGRIVQGSMSMLSKKQVVEDKPSPEPDKPSEKDFFFWFTADTSKITSKQTMRLDKITDYFYAKFPESEVNDLTRIIDDLVTIGAAKRYESRAYYLLMENGDIETTNDELYAAYEKIFNKEELDKDI